MRGRGWGLGVWVLGVVLACGGDERASERCAPGERVGCRCADGREGERSCEEGTLGPCVCAAARPSSATADPGTANRGAAEPGEPSAPSPGAPPTGLPEGVLEACAPAAGDLRPAPHMHLSQAFGRAAPAITEACGELDLEVDPTGLGMAFGACFARHRENPGAIQSCAGEGCCQVGLASLSGPAGDGEGSWIVVRVPLNVGDYTDHVYWLPPDGSRVEHLCTWAPYGHPCFDEGDLLDFEGCDMTPRQWTEIGLEVRRFLCNPPMPG
ncbi:MAG TPA: hypothetical protein RMH85_18570 [Polyangiaceae bacterium LLY-WYZ-15_(1-7)]|nr:hypothetical protein [Myxococcales bacterium]MAT24323.1 hypothetical protein [Sandaracinus sp.]HJK94948.1 hypothetical protein [Polyangiaceae bacterium LLY-WYZ-15_(1-7)]MBJ74746.1 hypothetical protein [Sandaracinus sp.]HJL04293.1 hypothetical protein [Polyangiaceae bacterium LLY-WYZ-15_(1-7)]